MIGKSHGEGLLCVKGQMEFRPKILRQPILLPIPHFLCVCHKLVPDTAKYLDFVVSVNHKSRKANYPTTNLERWTKTHEQRSLVTCYGADHFDSYEISIAQEERWIYT